MTTGVPAYSITPASNVQANTGVNWDEGMSPGAVNNSARANMADLRTAFNDLIWFQYGSGTSPVVTPAYASGTSFTVAGIDVTVPYHAGRRVKAVGSGTGTIYGSISSSSFSTNTTVNVTWDSGSLTNEALTIYLSQVPVTGKPIPGWNPTAGKTLSCTNNITLAATDGSSPLTLSTRQILTSGSAATYTTPAGVRQLRIRMSGGGGGGGGNGSSGSGSGGAGGTTIFNSINAAGGSGGPGADNGANSAGGTGGTGGTGSASFRAPGNAGQSGGVSSGNGAMGGSGGGSLLGGGARGGAGAAAAVANSGGGGSGGNNGSTAGALGGPGGGGGEYVEIIINSPAGTYTYTVGAAGTAGTAGVAGNAGGAGGTGVIIVDEIY